MPPSSLGVPSSGAPVPSSLQGPPTPQHTHPLPMQQPAQRWDPNADKVENVAGVPTPGRGWLAFGGVLLAFLVLASVLYVFLFRR